MTNVVDRQLGGLDVGTEAWADVARRSAMRLLVRQSDFAGDKIVPWADPMLEWRVCHNE